MVRPPLSDAPRMRVPPRADGTALRSGGAATGKRFPGERACGGGWSEVKRSLAGSSQGEPRAEPHAEAAKPANREPGP
jgi:hypothetical protein